MSSSREWAEAIVARMCTRAVGAWGLARLGLSEAGPWRIGLPSLPRAAVGTSTIGVHTVASVKVRTSPVTRGSPYVIFTWSRGDDTLFSNHHQRVHTLFSDGHLCGAFPSDSQ
jgi:hypothetical protein